MASGVGEVPGGKVESDVMETCILKARQVQVNQAPDVAQVVAIDPAQRRHTQPGIAAGLARMGRQVARGAVLQRARQHLLRAAAQRLVRQPIRVADEQRAGVVGEGGCDAVDAGTRTAGLQA